MRADLEAMKAGLVQQQANLVRQTISAELTARGITDPSLQALLTPGIANVGAVAWNAQSGAVTTNPQMLDILGSAMKRAQGVPPALQSQITPPSPTAAQPQQVPAIDQLAAALAAQRSGGGYL
jgi:hypothetical protein